MTDDLSRQLASVLEEIKEIMHRRKEHIEDLRNQIVIIENENHDLENKVNELIRDIL